MLAGWAHSKYGGWQVAYTFSIALALTQLQASRQHRWAMAEARGKSVFASSSISTCATSLDLGMFEGF